MATTDGTWQLGRDPALLGGVVLAVVQVVITMVPVSATQASLINAFVAAAIGFVVAVLVRSDRWVPALLGLGQAAGALVIGFGLVWTADQQAAVMVALAGITAVVTRTQVTAPVPPTVAAPRTAPPLVGTPTASMPPSVIAPVTIAGRPE